MKRLLTAAVAVPVALAMVFYLPGGWFFGVVLALMLLATWEYIRLVESMAPAGPYRALYLFVALAAVALVPELWLPPGTPIEPDLLWIGLFAVSAVTGGLVVMTRMPVEQGLTAVGFLAFGTAYLALPVASLYRLQQLEPWVVFLLLAIVWLGDSAAYYVGSSIGRRKMAPSVSPNKTWEGSAANLVTAILVAAIWSYWRLGAVTFVWLGIAALTSLAAQTGDLVESMIKRGSGVKDSGVLFPGHGGVLDRIDALMFAAPTLTLILLFADRKIPLP